MCRYARPDSLCSPPPAGPHAACGVGWPWGGVRGGGTLFTKESEESTPTPNPSPHSQRKHAARGGGEHGESAAPFSPICDSPGMERAIVTTRVLHQMSDARCQMPERTNC
jgi:hypothetical protein